VDRLVGDGDGELDARRPNSVVNLMTGFMATTSVLNGSPTVSPTTGRAWSGVPSP